MTDKTATETLAAAGTPAAGTPAAETPATPAPVAPEPAPAVAVAPGAAPAANPFAAPDLSAAPEAPRDRRALFASLRWTAAVLVFAATAALTAYAVVEPERTRIPGLSTLGDGRWDYPAITKPVLPAGAPLPYGPDNAEGIHYAALSQLLLPAPEGSTPDESLKADKDGMVAQDRFLAEFSGKFHDRVVQGLKEDAGLRQIAGRGWTTPDGTATRVYLLRFHSSGFVASFEGCKSGMALPGADSFDLDSAWSKALIGQSTKGRMEHTAVTTFVEEKPYGPQQTKVGCIQAGDLLGMVIQTRKDAVADVPFHQTVVLQDQLLE
ncbi:hypothetical protein ACFWAR_27135 [Streptomyces sp. NPDC059917]|uniref:hypothetical protein n=1 Tax=Streptomyces sp. NPDC059917 TaxID=3347002 RepID=UPI0036648A77